MNMTQFWLNCETLCPQIGSMNVWGGETTFNIHNTSVRIHWEHARSDQTFTKKINSGGIQYEEIQGFQHHKKASHSLYQYDSHHTICGNCRNFRHGSYQYYGFIFI